MVEIGKGSQAYVKYGWGTGVKDKTFGRRQGIPTFTAKRNLAKEFGIGSRKAEILAKGVFEGAIDVEFDIANPWWLKGLLGKVTTTGASAPYTHTFEMQNTIPAIEVEVGAGITGAEAFARKLKKAKIASGTISGAVEETIKGKLSILYLDEEKVATSTPVVDNEAIFTYANADLQLPAGTSLLKIQSFEVSISNALEKIAQLGSQAGEELLEKDFSIECTCSGIIQKYDLLQRVMGATTGVGDVTEIAQIDIIISNGKTGASLRKWTIKLYNCYVDAHGMSISGLDKIVEDLTIFAKDVKIEVQNATAVAL